MTTRISDLFDFNPIQSKENKILEFVKDRKPKYFSSTIDKSTFVGLEVEVERCSFPFSPSVLFSLMWSIDEDRSLREQGKEFRSIPLRGKNIPFALEELEDYFNKVRKESSNAAFDFSERTSVHVHMNVRNLTTEQLCLVLLLYIVFEKLFFKFADKSGQQRWESVFCVPIQESGDVLELYYAFANALHKEPTGRDTSEIFSRNWRKYTALNLLPIKDLGTIEFRHLGGNLNIPYLLEWISLIQALKNYSYTHSFKDTYEEVIKLNTTSDYSFFLLSVMGGIGNLFDRTNLQESMEDGVTLIKDFGSFKDPTHPKPTVCTLEDIEKSTFMRLFKFRKIPSLVALKKKGRTPKELKVIARNLYESIINYQQTISVKRSYEQVAQSHTLPIDLSQEEMNLIEVMILDIYGYKLSYPFSFLKKERSGTSSIEPLFIEPPPEEEPENIPLNTRHVRIMPTLR